MICVSRKKLNPDMVRFLSREYIDRRYGPMPQVALTHII